ncbi:MAG: NrfD/PsrC family molybdoenzyme membrane anchor subunit [Candidatus Heimdallarchaeota archaeon]
MRRITPNTHQTKIDDMMSRIFPKREFTWGVLVALALFFGGLGGGSFIISSITNLIAPNLIEVVVFGSIVGVISTVLCIFFFVADTGHPERSYRLFLNIRSSVISFGSTVLLLIIPLGIFYASFFLPELFPSIKQLTPWYDYVKPLVGLRKVLNLIMFILGISLVAYTGFVLGVARTNAFWETPLLPILFLASGISTTLATIGMSLTIFYPDRVEIIHKMGIAVLYILILELCINVLDIYRMLHESREEAVISARGLTRGVLKNLFWIGFIGIGLLLPITVITLLEFIGFNQLLVMVAMGLVIIGGIVMRYLIVIAGQLPILEREIQEYIQYGLL